MTDHRFDTPRPVQLYAELGRGTVRVTATETTQTVVEVAGREAEHVVVRQDGDRVTVVAPKQRGGLFGGDSRLDVAITLPTSSAVVLRSGSADITVEGRVGSTQLKSGSGDVVLEAADDALLVETGSGDVRVGSAGAELKVKSGSGDVAVHETLGPAVVSTGSGDVRLGATHAPVVVKTGSGSLGIAEAESDISMTTGSGDLSVTRTHRGRVTVKGASGDVAIGIPAGVPVWTDISTISGDIRSDLPSTGEPREGADHVEVRAKTASGDVVLTQV